MELPLSKLEKEKFYLDADINQPWFEILNLRPRDKAYYVNYIEYLKKVIEKGNHKKTKRILLSTIHGAKGLESAASGYIAAKWQILSILFSLHAISSSSRDVMSPWIK